jgi:type I restriction enzyme, S subunit
MVIKPGYKQSEIGVIPKDWEVLQIKELFSLSAGGDFKPKLSNQIQDDLYRYPIYSNALTNKGLYGYSSYYTNEENSITITARGSLGNANYRNCKFTAIGRVLSVYPLKELDSRFYAEYINKYIHIVTESTGVPQLTAPQFGTYLVPYPKIEEQSVIATVLSDIDSLITSLDNLINKKKLIKQGAMQELLTGKRRLPGFEGEWVEKKLTSLVFYQEGPGVRNYQFTQSGVKLLNGTNISKGTLKLNNTDRYISSNQAYGIYSHFLADEGDIIIACSGISIDMFHEKVAIIRVEDLPLCMNTSTMRFKISSEFLYDRFFYYFLQSTDFKNQIAGKATGSAQLNFGPSHVSKIVLSLPTVEEQMAISDLLSDMDSEIKELEQQLDKYKQMKQGMMQELLTGRIRLCCVN